ncbi:hypothetical protein QFX18_03315 [Saccharophagus degradans]|uniref:hypothetical protein n=1 Tax=Saccharophagus degradans TaxID=86304 RepID=UPI002478149F|nr:hypothetical protein [Saccharophagus degradans]WGO99088.1 hypothetical protein QFX18_03315 [Saccharophagus degradans]
MKNCPHCAKQLSFWDVLRAVNPASIPCGGCHKNITVNKKSAFTIAGVAVLVSIVICLAVQSAGLGMPILVASVVLLGLLLEVGYYLCLTKGVIKSDLQ